MRRDSEVTKRAKVRLRRGSVDSDRNSFLPPNGCSLGGQLLMRRRLLLIMLWLLLEVASRSSKLAAPGGHAIAARMSTESHQISTSHHRLVVGCGQLVGVMGYVVLIGMLGPRLRAFDPSLLATRLIKGGDRVRQVPRPG